MGTYCCTSYICPQSIPAGSCGVSADVALFSLWAMIRFPQISAWYPFSGFQCCVQPVFTLPSDELRSVRTPCRYLYSGAELSHGNHSSRLACAPWTDGKRPDQTQSDWRSRCYHQAWNSCSLPIRAKSHRQRNSSISTANNSVSYRLIITFLFNSQSPD